MVTTAADGWLYATQSQVSGTSQVCRLSESFSNYWSLTRAHRNFLISWMPTTISRVISWSPTWQSLPLAVLSHNMLDMEVNKTRQAFLVCLMLICRFLFLPTPQLAHSDFNLDLNRPRRGRLSAFSFLSEQDFLLVIL